MASGKKKTHEEFIQLMEVKQPNIEVLGTYINSQTKIKCRCKIDGYEWEVRPNSLLRKNSSGCPKCGRMIANQKTTKTHEQFIEELAQVNPNIEILGNYKNSSTKIKVRCRIDGHIWKVIPSSLLSGIGCPKCGYRNNGQKRTKTHEKFIEELKQINPNIVVMGTYVNNKTSIRCRCKVCGHEWKPTPSSLLQGQGCPKCGRISATQKTAQKLTKTHGQFLQELQQVNSDIEVLETYKNGHTKIKVRCKICGHKWEAEPSNLTHGHKNGCPKCAINNMRKTHQQFITELKQVNDNIEVIGTYVNAHSKILCRCKKDGYEWETRPHDLLRGVGCPKCKFRKQAEQQTKTHEQFIQELQQVNPDIEVLETYKGANNKVKVRCKIEGHEWEATPANLLYGHGCPKCAITKGEKRVAQYLDNLDIEYIYNKQYFNDLVGINGGILRPDFIIPALKIWIEFDGQQHFRPVDFTGKMSEQEVQEQFKQVQQNDQIKNQYAKDHNWTLVRIAYWDYDNIEQILDSYLKQEEVI